MERCGLLPKIKMMTGGTDAQILGEKGIQMVVMGMAARKAHTVEEYVEMSEMEKMVEVLRTIFADLCG